MAKDKETAFFGHPIGLSSLFATELWERFSYYGMRALLVLFLTAELINGGFGLAELDAFTIYGIFTALVYVTPIIGGILADKVLGQRKAIYIGGITMAIGQFFLASAAVASGGDLEVRKLLFYAGLGILIFGNGFFKPNISTMVGQLYKNNDPRQDGGFTIFYMGINLGAFLSPLVAGKLGEQVAWEYGYLSAGIGMLIGTVWFFLRSHTLGHIGMPPKVKSENVRLMLKDWYSILIYVGAIVAVVLAFVYGWGSIDPTIRTWSIYIVAFLGTAYLLISIIKGTNGRTEWSRIGVIGVLALFNIFFWSGFEQTGTTFNSPCIFNFMGKTRPLQDKPKHAHEIWMGHVDAKFGFRNYGFGFYYIDRK
jgi:proton-dependent oligopeptide transporter, POT family